MHYLLCTIVFPSRPAFENSLNVIKWMKTSSKSYREGLHSRTVKEDNYLSHFNKIDTQEYYIHYTSSHLDCLVMSEVSKQKLIKYYWIMNKDCYYNVIFPSYRAELSWSIGCISLNWHSIFLKRIGFIKKKFSIRTLYIYFCSH